MKIIDMVVSLLRKEETKIQSAGHKISDAYLEITSDESIWSNFETEILSPIIDDFKNLIERLRKRYCIYYSSQINRKMRLYFRELVQVTEEPVDIQPEFLNIVL